jgi:hypothetical protein
MRLLWSSFTNKPKSILVLRERLGLNLEMLFRAADSERKNLILLDEFRIFLGKIKLNLSDPEINKIIQIIDDDCSETLKKSSYY